MKLQMIKLPGGLLTPASEMELTYLNKLKNDGQYEIEIKMTRNPQYHRRAFKFLNFCFEYWSSDKTFLDEKGQFDCFRKDLMIQAGFYDQHYSLDGQSFQLVARSISFAKMNQLEFQQCYNALVNASMRSIFKENDAGIFEKLMSFFD
jgi:hypothetical protein